MSCQAALGVVVNMPVDINIPAYVMITGNITREYNPGI